MQCEAAHIYTTNFKRDNTIQQGFQHMILGDLYVFFQWLQESVFYSSDKFRLFRIYTTTKRGGALFPYLQGSVCQWHHLCGLVVQIQRS
jgi:hypothetical protein